MSSPAEPKRHPPLTVQAFWLMVAKTIGFVLSTVLPVLLVRIFSQHDYGLYRQAFVVVGSVYAVLGLGVGISAFYYLPRRPDKRSQIVLNILIANTIAGVSGLLLLSLNPSLLIHLFGGPELVPYARVIGCIVFLAIFSSFLEYIATALQDVKRSTIFIVFAQLSKLIFMTTAALWWSSLGALLYATVLQGILQSAILLWYLHRQFGRFWTSFDWHFFCEQIGYALPYGLNALLLTAQGDAHKYFVSNAFGPSGFAIYAVGCLQLPLLGLLRDSITTVMVSKTSELQHQGKPREILLLTARAMRKTAFIYLPVYAAMLVVGRDFLILLYTRQYEASWPIFAVNLTMLPLLIIITDPIIRAYAEHRYFIVWVRAVLVCVQLATLWFMIHSLGPIGAILTLVVMTVLERTIVSWKIASILGMRRADLALFRSILNLALLSAACAALAYVVRIPLAGAHPLVALFVGCLAFGLPFVAGLFFFHMLDSDELDLLRRQLRRVLRLRPGARAQVQVTGH